MSSETGIIMYIFVVVQMALKSVDVISNEKKIILGHSVLCSYFLLPTSILLATAKLFSLSFSPSTTYILPL